MVSLLSTKENALFKSVISTGRSNAEERSADTVERTVIEALKSMCEDADVGRFVSKLVVAHGEDQIRLMMAKVVTHIGLVISSDNVVGVKPTVSMQKASSKISSASTSSAASVRDDADSATQRVSSKSTTSTPTVSATSETSRRVPAVSQTSGGTTTTSSSNISGKMIPINAERREKLNQILQKIQTESRSDIRRHVSTVTHCKFKLDDMKAVHKELSSDAGYTESLPKLSGDASYTLANMQAALRAWITDNA